MTSSQPDSVGVKLEKVDAVQRFSRNYVHVIEKYSDRGSVFVFSVMA